MTLKLGRNDFFRPNKNVAQTHIKYTNNFAQSIRVCVCVCVCVCIYNNIAGDCILQYTIHDFLICITTINISTVSEKCNVSNGIWS